MKRIFPTLLAFSLLAGSALATEDAVNVPVLLKPVKSGESIVTENLATHEIDRRNVYASTVTTSDELVGTVATRALPAGQPINRLHVRTARAVMRDSGVKVVFNRPGISLAGSGCCTRDAVLEVPVVVHSPSTWYPVYTQPPPFWQPVRARSWLRAPAVPV